MNNYFTGLNQPQREAVEYCDGPLIVIAGAGSGKTRVLTYKIAHLLQNGYQPWSVLALTFTNKAAREMKDRLERIVGSESARALWMGTFHSIFLKILRIEHEAIGFAQNFTIYDASDSKSLVKAIIKEMGLDDKVYKSAKVLGAISNAKNSLIDAYGYTQNLSSIRNGSNENMPELAKIFLSYQNRCRQSQAMDFDDILLYTYQLFSKNEDIRDKWAQRFKYVLVDEYQDTNYAQHQIVWQLTCQHKHICVVGDDAQSIYGFRGAKIDNILNFEKTYEGARLFKLEQNYRSTQSIVEAANSLISRNDRQIKKNVFSANSQGDKLHVLDTYSDIEEARVVVNTLKKIRRQENCDYSDFAILYRTNAQSRTFEDAMRKDMMPYRIYGGLSFYQRKEVKDVIAYFRLVVNPDDEEAFKRIINYPARGIGQTTLAKIAKAATEHGVSFWNVTVCPENYGLAFNKGTLSKLKSFSDMMVGFMGNLHSLNAYQLGLLIVRNAGIMADLYQDESVEAQSRRENVEELMNGIMMFCETRQEEGDEQTMMSDYLSEVSLMSDVETDDGDNEDKVTLMTIHSSKGLEFGTVFIVGMEDGLFPSERSVGNPREIEEERRLCYVAITRAKKHCYMTYSRSRYQYGTLEKTRPSRFLNDIDACYLDKSESMTTRATRNANYEIELPWLRRGSMERDSKGMTPARPFTPSSPSRNPLPRRETDNSVESRSFQASAEMKKADVPVKKQQADSNGLHVGSRILHNRFGKGTVECIEGNGDKTKLTIKFDNLGTKQLLVKYATFEILS